MNEEARADTTINREGVLIAAARLDAAELARASAGALPPVDSIAGYRLIREIGRGGMGVVYEAEQEHPRRAVALKMIGGGPLVDKHHLTLFQREVQTLARLRHPGIAAIYEAGQTDHGRPFFTMELIRGTPLAEHARLKQLSLREQLQLFRRLCEAVHYAHQRGVIHRDLKPSNVIVDGEGNPKILDFGLARLGDADGTVSTASMEVGKIMGTLPYMSPEQASVTPNEPPPEVDVRSDVYSLGVILYELLAGQLPYDVSKAPPHEAFGIICRQAPRRPSTVNRELRGDLETIVLKALAKEPAQRYDSVAALADDITRYLSDQAIRARPPSAGYLLRKWAARHRSACTLLLVMAVVFAAFASVLLIQSAEISRRQMEIDAMRQPPPIAVRMTQGAKLRQAADRLQENAQSLVEQGKDEAAEPLLRECRTFRRDTLGDGHPLTAYTDSLLGASLTRLGQFEEAEPLLLSSYSILVASHGENDEKTLGALQQLIALYEAWGKPRQAAEWRAKLPTTRPAPTGRVR